MFKKICTYYLIYAFIVKYALICKIKSVKINNSVEFTCFLVGIIVNLSHVQLCILQLIPRSNHNYTDVCILYTVVELFRGPLYEIRRGPGL